MEPGESHAGIAVPEGDPEAVRSTAQTFKGMAGSLERSAHGFASLPGELSGWQGPASVAFASVAHESGSAAREGSVAFDRKAQAADRLADELEQAQHRARQAISDAKDAERRIRTARREIADARSRHQRALERIAAAELVIVATDLIATAPADAYAERDQAQRDADQAEQDQQRAKRTLDRAQDDLQDAQRAGRRAQGDAQDATTTAAGAFTALAANVPQLAPLAGPATGITTNPTNPFAGIPALVPMRRLSSDAPKRTGHFPALRPTPSFDTSAPGGRAIQNIGNVFSYGIDPALSAALPGTARQAEVARRRFFAAGRDASKGVPGSYSRGLPALWQARRLESSPLVRAARSPVGTALHRGLPVVGFGLDYAGNRADGESAQQAAGEAAVTTGMGMAGAAAGGAACGTAAAASFGLGAATCPVAIGLGGAVGTFVGKPVSKLGHKLGLY